MDTQCKIYFTNNSVSPADDVCRTALHRGKKSVAVRTRITFYEAVVIQNTADGEMSLAELCIFIPRPTHCCD